MIKWVELLWFIFFLWFQFFSSGLNFSNWVEVFKLVRNF